MVNRISGWSLAAAILAAVGSTASAQQQPSYEQMQKQIEQLRAEMAQMRAEQGDNWLNERRKEEVKALVHEVLSDADTRASLQAEGMTAGHDGSNFFLASADGTFLLEIAGQIQVRYIANFRDDDFVDEDFDDIDDTDIDELESGFQIRRTKLNFSGHIGTPKFGYDITLAADRSDNSVGLEDVVFEYEIADGFTIQAGRQKLPFLREELTSSKRLLAVERASVTEVFTLNRSEGVWLIVEPADNIRLTAAVSDGENAGNIGGANDFHEDRTDFAITARADVALAGNLRQARDFTAWEGEELGIFLGGAIHYEWGETGDSVAGNHPDYFSWTVDASVEMFPFHVFASFTGGHPMDVLTVDEFLETSFNDFDNYGFLVQAGVHVIPNTLEPFIRYEWIDIDGGDEVNLITFGMNYYVKNHNAKFTLDVVWGLDPITSSMNQQAGFGSSGNSSGLGLRSDDGDEDGQVAVRAQFQLLF